MIADYSDFVLKCLQEDICRNLWYDEHAFSGEVQEIEPEFEGIELTVLENGKNQTITWNEHSQLLYENLNKLYDQDLAAGIEARVRPHQNLSSALNFTNPNQRTGKQLEVERTIYYCNSIGRGQTRQGLIPLANYLIQWTDDATQYFRKLNRSAVSTFFATIGVYLT